MIDKQFMSSSRYISRLDLSVSVNLVVESHSDTTDSKYADSRDVIEQELINLQNNGLRPEFLGLLDKTSGEQVYKFTSIPPKKGDISPIHGYGGMGKTQLLKSIIETTTYLSQSIADNKTTLDIITDFATIIGATIPITSIVFRLLHLDKAYHDRHKKPSVTISIGDASVTFSDIDLKDTEQAIKRITRQFLKENPDALPSKQVSITGKLISPIAKPKSKKTNARRRQKKGASRKR